MADYITIEYSGGIRPSQTTTTYEQKYGQLSQPGQKISPGKITIPKDRASEFIRAMKYAGYGYVTRSYGAYSSGQPTAKSQVLMSMAADTEFEQEKQRQLEAANKTDVQFQGPVPKGASEETFRKTGKTVVQQRSFVDMARDPFNLEQRQSKITHQTQQSRAYQGPVPQGTSEQVFRQTGKTEPIKQTEFQQKIEQQAMQEPLGTPTQTIQKPWYKTAYHGVTDFLSGIAGGVYLEHFGRETTRTAPQIKEQFQKDVDYSLSDYKQGVTPKSVLTYIFGGPNLAQTKFIVKSGQTAREIRREGELTQAQRKQQIAAIEKSAKSLENLQTEFAPKYEKKVTQLNKDVQNLEAEIEAFNIVYGKRDLSAGQYYVAQQKQAELEAKRMDLTTQQKELKAEYDLYEKEILGEIGALRKSGIKTEVTPTGELTFTSKALKTELAPIGMKLQKSFLSKEGKVTWKNIAYGGGYVARATGEAFLLGAVAGGTGALAKVGTLVNKLPKAAKVGTYVVGGGAVLVGTGASAYQGYIYGEKVGIGKIGAVVGGAKAIGQLGGFIAGGYVGTKAYYQKLEQNILAGKYTRKTNKLIRQGYQLEDKGRSIGKAGQKGIYETKIKETDYKIKTDAQLMGKYAGKKGTSVLEIKSEWVGKKLPKNVPKTFETYGKTLESKKYVLAKLYTRGANQKAWTRQDVFIKRTFLDKLKISLDEPKGIFGPKGKTILVKDIEAFKFKSDISLFGKAAKVKRIPYEINFKDFLQKASKEGLTPEMKELTRQVVLYPPKRTAGTTTLRTFRSVGQAGGISDKYLKSLLSKEITRVKVGKVTTFFKLGSKGQVLIQQPTPLIQQPKIPLSSGKIPSLMSENALLKTALKTQLGPVLPGILSKQFALSLPGAIAVSSTALGLKNVLSTRAIVTPTIKLEQATNLKINMIEKMATKVSQAQITQPILTQQVVTPTVTSLSVATPLLTSFTTPTMPTVPRIPIIAPLPQLPRGFRQRGYRQPTKRPKEKGVYVEGFTSKALGLDAVKISQSQAKALLKKVLTGLEIRRRVIVTPNKRKSTKRRRKK